MGSVGESAGWVAPGRLAGWVPPGLSYAVLVQGWSSAGQAVGGWGASSAPLLSWLEVLPEELAALSPAHLPSPRCLPPPPPACPRPRLPCRALHHERAQACQPHVCAGLRFRNALGGRQGTQGLGPPALFLLPGSRCPQLPALNIAAARQPRELWAQAQAAAADPTSLRLAQWRQLPHPSPACLLPSH